MELKQTFKGGHDDSILCADRDPNSGFVVTGGEGGELCLWDAFGNVLQKAVIDADSDCTSVCFTKKESGILFAAVGAKVFRFSCSSLETPAHTFTCNTDEVNQIALDPSERYLAACDDAGDVKIIDVKRKKLYKTLKMKHSNICSSICFHPTCTTDLFSGGMDQQLIHWIYPQHRAQASYNMADILAKLQDVEGYMINPPLVYHLDISPGGQLLACGLQSGHMALFSSSQRDLQLHCIIKAHEEGVSQVRFVSKNLLVTGGNDALIRLWDLSRLCQEKGEREGDEGCSTASKRHGTGPKTTGSADARTPAQSSSASASGNRKFGAAVKSDSSRNEFGDGGSGMQGSTSQLVEEDGSGEACGSERVPDNKPHAANGANAVDSLAQSLSQSVLVEEQEPASASASSESQSEYRLLLSFQHSSKINWLVPFRENGETFLAVADQSSELTILKFPVH